MVHNVVFVTKSVDIQCKILLPIYTYIDKVLKIKSIMCIFEYNLCKSSLLLNDNKQTVYFERFLKLVVLTECKYPYIIMNWCIHILTLVQGKAKVQFLCPVWKKSLLSLCQVCLVLLFTLWHNYFNAILWIHTVILISDYSLVLMSTPYFHSPCNQTLTLLADRLARVPLSGLSYFSPLLVLCVVSKKWSLK